MKSERQHHLEIQWLDIADAIDCIKDLILSVDNRNIKNELAKALGVACGEYDLLHRQIKKEFPYSIANIPLEDYLDR